MPNIFLIGKGTFKKGYKDILTSKDNKIKRFESLGAVLPKLNENPDLLIVDRKEGTEPAFKEFLRLSRNIPKIVISDTYGGLKSWIKESLTYPFCSPGVKELRYLVNRALKERELLLEKSRLKSDSSILRQELDFYEEVRKALTSSTDLNDILDTIMKKAKALTKAEAWTVFLLDEGTEELVFERTEGKKTKETEKFRVKIGEGIAGWVAKEGMPILVPDVSQDKRFLKKMDRAFNSKHKIKSIMCIPIKSREKPFGVIEVFNKTTGEPFTREDFNQLIDLIDKAAIIIERALLYQKVEELSITDDLTKLFNTRYLNRTIEMEIQRSLRYRTSVSLIFMDIDYFKQINDRYGHLIGSKILAEMGQLLIRNLRAIDVVVRYGGDEFVIVLPHTPPAAAAQIAERIRKAVEQNVFLEKEGYSLRITASFGVASYPESAKSKEELLRLADEAMYKVKYHTKNGVHAII